MAASPEVAKAALLEVWAASGEMEATPEETVEREETVEETVETVALVEPVETVKD